MNPLAALLASLTGATPGQSAGSPSGGAGADLFAGLLAALGEGNQSGETTLPGASAASAPSGGGAQASLLIALEGEGGLASIAGAAPQSPQAALKANPNSPLPGPAPDDTAEGLLGLLGQAAGISAADPQLQATTASPGDPEAANGAIDGAVVGQAENLPTGSEIDGLATTAPQASTTEADDDPTSDGADISDPLSLLFAGAGQTTPPIAETPPQGQSADLAATDGTAEAKAPGPVAPATAGAQAAPPGVPPQTSPSDSGAANKPAAAPANRPAPAPQPQHAAPFNGAPQPGSAAQSDGSAGDSQVAAAGDDASLAADFDQALEASADATRSDAAGRLKPPAGNSSLEALLQQSQPHQGDGQTRVPPAAGAADMGGLPQQTRPAAPAATSLPPVPIAAVAVNIAQQVQAGAKRFEIRLDPPELGRVEVRLNVTREGHATTHLVVERSETLDMLQRDARQLERALQNAGLNTSNGDLTFSLKDQGNAHHQGSGGGEQQPTTEALASSEPVEEDWQPVPIRGLGQAGIDIRI